MQGFFDEMARLWDNVRRENDAAVQPLSQAGQQQLDEAVAEMMQAETARTEEAIKQICSEFSEEEVALENRMVAVQENIRCILKHVQQTIAGLSAV